MDIFKFRNPNSPTLMEHGEVISGLTSKMWVERYAQAGEFELVAPVSTGMREKLPIGTFISHIDTTEIMIVENHEISDNQEAQVDIKITGRGFETFLENRIVGSNKTFPFNAPFAKDPLPAGNTWAQVSTLINRYIGALSLNDDNYALPYVICLPDIAGAGIQRARRLDIGTVYERALELMDIDKIGIKTVRYGPWSPTTVQTTYPGYVLIQIHKGVDRTQEVVFSYDSGEIVSADYLWSNKSMKNAALVTGKWIQVVVNPSEVQYNRRMMAVTATDVDDEYTVAPAGANRTAVIAELQQRGIEALASQNNVALTKAEASKQSVSTRYRMDFDVGDLVTVIGDYNEETTMRVSEFVEIEDKTGSVGYPTLIPE